MVQILGDRGMPEEGRFVADVASVLGSCLLELDNLQ